jgi:hypothetical protein
MAIVAWIQGQRKIKNDKWKFLKIKGRWDHQTERGYLAGGRRRTKRGPDLPMGFTGVAKEKGEKPKLLPSG